MPIDLTENERGAPFTGDYDAELTSLQDRLGLLQRAQIAHRRRIILILEGWTGAGKKSALRSLAAAWDPCQLSVKCVGPVESGDDDRHWLAPFWGSLPAAGATTIFFRSWYRRICEQRHYGRHNDRQWARALDEINEFESQQFDHGTLILKFFFHVDGPTQVARVRERQSDPWLGQQITAEDLDIIRQRDAIIAMLHDMFAHTDTRWAPWRIIDAGDERAARIQFLTMVADTMEKAIPQQPPLEEDNVISFRGQKQA